MRDPRRGGPASTVAGLVMLGWICGEIVILQFFRDDEATVITAANDGARAHPGWYFNLTADPDVQVEVNGRTIAVHAEEIPAEEAPGWWQRILERDPTYARYERATTRTFPIIRLVPIDASGS